MGMTMGTRKIKKVHRKHADGEYYNGFLVFFFS
jgi:hypothetical protein